MNDTKAPESAYSDERTKITGPDSLRSAPEPAESAHPKNQKALPEMPNVAGSLTETVHPVGTASGAIGAIGDFAEFLKRTKWIWLIATGAIFVLMAMATVSRRMSEQAKVTRAARQEQAVTEVTVDAVLARCGQPAEDTTKEMYPIVLRTISYQPRESEKVVLEFSRTAEEKSDWVFLSMKDPSGARKFDTPEAKIAALPCLDTKK